MSRTCSPLPDDGVKIVLSGRAGLPISGLKLATIGWLRFIMNGKFSVMFYVGGGLLVPYAEEVVWPGLYATLYASFGGSCTSTASLISQVMEGLCPQAHVSSSAWLVL